MRKNEEQTYSYEDEDKYRDKVIRSRDGVFIGQTEEVHDGRTHAQYALDFVSRRLVCIDGPDLRLSRGPGGFFQVNLQHEKQKEKKSSMMNEWSRYIYKKKMMMTIPLGLGELCDWPSRLWRAAGCVHGKACERPNTSVHDDRETHPVQTNKAAALTTYQTKY